MEELAGVSDVSIGQVAIVKKLLNDQEWIDSKTVGFSLTDPMTLLEIGRRIINFDVVQFWIFTQC